jgi:hypothetical protein
MWTRFTGRDFSTIKIPASITDLKSQYGGPYWNRVEPGLAVAGSGGIAAPTGGDAGVSRGLGQRIDW